jgi:uncharacterized phiE125 gp8 family phage protein
MRTYLQLVTPPTVEPVTLAEAKRHLHLDGSLAADVETTASIPAGDHVIAAAFSLEGAPVEVLGLQALALLDVGAIPAGATLTVKLQERDLLTDAWADVTGGAFDAVTAANDEQVFSLAYAGIKKYLRAVATVAGDVIPFGLSIQTYNPDAAEDSTIQDKAISAREFIEEQSERSLCAQTWDLYMDAWPADNGPIKLPRGPIQSVTSVKYTDSAEVQTTLTVTTDYLVSTVQAKIIPAYNKCWPMAALRPIDAIVVRYVAGYVTVPRRYREAVLLVTSWGYNHRGDDPHDMDASTMRAVKALIGPDSLGVPFA